MEKIAADLLLKGLAPEGFADSQPIGLVTTDSREVCPGCIFVAFPVSVSTATISRPRRWKRARPMSSSTTRWRASRLNGRLSAPTATTP